MAHGATFFKSKRELGSEFTLSELDLEGASDESHRTILGGLPQKHGNAKAHLRAVHEEQFFHWFYLLK